MLERYAIYKSAIGLDQNQYGGDSDHRADEHGCEEFGLVVAERMVEVGGLGADADCDKSGDGGHDVDEAFERVRKQGDGAGNLVGDIFQDDDRKSDGDIYAGDRCRFCFQCRGVQSPCRLLICRCQAPGCHIRPATARFEKLHRQ